MAHEQNEDVPDLLILPRPQISVMLNKDDEIVISTASISVDYDRVEHDEIVIPLESGREVGEAILAIVASRAG